MMNEDLWTQAEKLALRPYSIEIARDRLTDGTIIYVAQNPELPGCKSQGEALEEAVDNLSAARIDYIYSLLEDQLDVPLPQAMLVIS